MADDDVKKVDSDENKPDENIKKGWFARHRRIFLIGGPVLLLVVVGVFYLRGGRYITTDDAYIQAARVEVSANISGRVVKVNVHDNQHVHAGDVLFEIDDRPFRLAVNDAAAKLAEAKLQVRALQATYQQRKADEKAATDTLAYQQREFNREKKLAVSGIASTAQVDQATHNLDAARQQTTASGEQSANILASLGGTPDIPVADHPDVQEAQAELDRANLNLSYTIVRASMDGIVTKVEQIQVGDYSNAAAPQFALVSDSDIWVEANFKETELTYMHPGQPATFTIDTYPGKTFTGKVQSTSPGTGSIFSLLPPENATGNWVKVVQRLPVRLSIDPSGVTLHAGLSVNASVDSGHHRSIFFWREGE